MTYYTVMYLPGHFRQTDLNVLHDFMTRHSFATVCSQHEGEPFASHLPLLLERGAGPFGTLIGHMARANPQWRQAEGAPVLAVFQGPHAYISPTWYQADDVVPTWNYAAVHAYGRWELVEQPEALLEIVRQTVAFYEQSQPRPWQMGGSPGFVERMLQAIVGFRIEITRLEGKWKLNQNHSAERRQRVIEALERSADAEARAIGDLMRGL